MDINQVAVRVKGDLALFTRPENKVERVSYPLPTPSAARGILEAIYWHPQFRWVVREIRVLKEPKSFGIFRNEVNSKMSPSRAEPYFADDDRSQRFSVCLRDVDYIIVAEPIVKAGVQEHPKKFREILERRVKRGQCYHRPALGCREFAAEFEPVDDALEPISWNENLGLMLWDVIYPEGTHDEKGWHPKSKPPFAPKFFEAVVTNGVMRIPDLAVQK